MPTKFYLYDQNNSGGSFDIDDEKGIGPHVWIEAHSLDDAIARAERLGIYFNGVEDGRDCGCCGDRWSTPYTEKDMFEIRPEWDFNWWNCVYVHFINGQIERINKDNFGQKAVS